MEVEFATRRLQKVCNSEKESTREYGDRCARLLRRRLWEIDAAESLGDLLRLPGPRCHALTGDRGGQYAVDLEYPKRLVFEPADDPVPRRPDGGVEVATVKRGRVIGVVDYH